MSFGHILGLILGSFIGYWLFFRTVDLFPKVEPKAADPHPVEPIPKQKCPRCSQSDDWLMPIDELDHWAPSFSHVCMSCYDKLMAERRITSAVDRAWELNRGA